MAEKDKEKNKPSSKWWWVIWFLLLFIGVPLLINWITSGIEADITKRTCGDSPRCFDSIKADTPGVITAPAEVHAVVNDLYALPGANIIDNTLGQTGNTTTYTIGITVGRHGDSSSDDSTACNKFTTKLQTCAFKKDQLYTFDIDHDGVHTSLCVNPSIDESTKADEDKFFAGIWYRDSNPGSDWQPMDVHNLPKDIIAIRYKAARDFTFTHVLREAC